MDLMTQKGRDGFKDTESEKEYVGMKEYPRNESFSNGNKCG